MFFIQKDLNIVEIGPGMGHFTRFLLLNRENYQAIEIDKGFYTYLSQTFQEKIKLYHQDFLKFDFKNI